MTPLKDDLPEDARRLLDGATRGEAVHGASRTVWHCWGSGRNLVLLHGGSGSWTHWIRNVQALADAGWRVCVPDLPGFGDSQAAPDATDAPDLVEPIAHAIREMTEGQACPVVGFSFGSLTATLTAAAHPGLMSRLVLVGAPALGLRSQRFPLTPWSGVTDPEERKRIQGRNLQALMLHQASSIDDFTIALHAANLRRDRLRNRKGGYSELVARTLPTLTIPVDAVYGEEDALYTGQMDEAEAILRKAPTMGEVVRIARAGHWVQYEESALFNGHLLRLLG